MHLRLSLVVAVSHPGQTINPSSSKHNTSAKADCLSGCVSTILRSKNSTFFAIEQMARHLWQRQEIAQNPMFSSDKNLRSAQHMLYCRYQFAPIQRIRHENESLAVARPSASTLAEPWSLSSRSESSLPLMVGNHVHVPLGHDGELFHRCPNCKARVTALECVCH